ncbi:MAG: hypothetical protein OZSIB_3794 [Candidatus Ozemobacter sibiricus]|jgi:tetratricopeptide (TPR) repeat protein|uniref:Tetratricopeptide repeat protein n=1 Tax=Candidatus Ozemobacter sibiricus TaxID=2268124 RepID=A0A367ZP65_9BACT|nr:MAG: hypothetical protein OZSIB_3794 [Candidatus Ozemobacter sibiricus]
MRRLCTFGLLVIGLAVLLSGFAAPPEPSIDLQQYQRLPLSIRLTRLTQAGIHLFDRRRYEEAIAVFESIFQLDPKNLGAMFWIRKCQEKLARERNELAKADLYRKYGGLGTKEWKYDNWTWGPTVGHFVIRQSKPKPYVPPVRKRTPRASDEVLAKAKEKAAGGDPQALFELAMQHWSRGEKEPALDAFEEAVEKDPEIAGLDDEEMLARISDEITAIIAKGGASAAQHLLAGRVARLQGDLPGMIRLLVKAVTLDPTLADKARSYLETMVVTGKAQFLLKLPEIFSFRQAYAFEEGEDRFYLKTTFAPSTPFPMVPLDLMFDWTAIKSIDILASDVLFVFVDPAVQGMTRLWLTAREKEGPFPNYYARLLIHLDPDRLPSMDLSNVNVSPDLPDNWSMVIGPDSSFGQAFPPPQYESTTENFLIRGYQLGTSNGRGPSLVLRDFRIAPPPSLDVWKALDAVGSGI